MSVQSISEYFVRPNKEVEDAKKPRHLNPVDLFQLLNGSPIQQGLLFPFPNKIRPDIRLIFERLRLSLSIALVHFYSLAGCFEIIPYEDEHACSVYLDCTKGPGARLIHATMDLTAFDILSSIDVHPAVRMFYDLGEKTVNLDGRTKPMLCIQVTELQDGVFMGFSMNHSVVDGTSFIHFVSMLSAIFCENSIKISREPKYNFQVPSPIIKLPMPLQETPRVPDLLRTRIFHFSCESIATLKAKANEECFSSDNDTKVISSYMALSGLVWRSITRAHAPRIDEETSCFVALDARTRLDPSLTEDHFGNVLGGMIALCKVDELLGRGLGWGARYLAQEIEKVNHHVICETMKGIANVLTLDPLKEGRSKLNGAKTHVIMAGSHRFDMYGPEFGLGRAAAVLIGSAHAENGKVMANPGCEGRGSVDLEIILKPHLMSALESDEDFMSYVNVAGGEVRI